MYITNPIRTDGFGAQYQCIIFHALYSELKGYKFAYREFSSMEHNYENDPHFLEKKEQLINLRNNFPSFDDVPKNEIFVPNISHVYAEVENNLDSTSNFENYKLIKEYFFQNKSFEKSGFPKKASIHIRRWNTDDEDNQDFRYTEDSYFINAINEIKISHPYLQDIIIHSQGEEKNFEVFSNLGCTIKLNNPIEKTFIELVTSDVLIMCRSSLSYSAGLISDGIIYYLPFWHKPKSTWLKF